MSDLETYEIEAEIIERIFDILSALDDIKETLPPHIVGLLESFEIDKEVIH